MNPRLPAQAPSPHRTGPALQRDFILQPPRHLWPTITGAAATMASSNAQWLRPHCSPGGRAQLPSTQRKKRRLESLAAWPQITQPASGRASAGAQAAAAGPTLLTLTARRREFPQLSAPGGQGPGGSRGPHRLPASFPPVQAPSQPGPSPSARCCQRRCQLRGRE